MKNKKWTVRYATEDGFKYGNVVGDDVQKVIDYFVSELGIDTKAIDYLSSEECIVL